MRPVRLDLAGFTVFREATTIDFTGAEFFALLGPTGSGKSTVLDAVCFALYGTVPRWDNVRSVENALSPSASEGRVRLVFDAAGQRYVASRVLRRNTRSGKVTTVRAGLERLSPDHDPAALDDPSVGELGEVLAGTPSEMTEAVAEAVGLPYEQFVTCVLLPQGAFAEFLHARPAKRQEILVNLLGLKVYERIGERARQRARDQDGRRDAIDAVLAGMPDATEQAVAEAAERVTALRGLADAVEAALPDLTAAQRRAERSREALAALDAEGKLLASVARPAGVAELAAAVTEAAGAAEDAAGAVGAAERAEEEAHRSLDAAGAESELRRALDRRAERGTLAAEEARLAERVAAAGAERDEAATVAERAAAGLAEAERALAAAQTAETAAALRPELVVGEPCPVCAQNVAELPAAHDAPTLAEARSAVAAARRRRDGTDRAARQADAEATAAIRRRDEATDRLAALDAELSGAPPAEELTRRLEAVARLRAGLEQGRRAVRDARQRQRTAAGALERAERALRDAWRAFDAARDAVAALGPPAADRDDLAAAWTALADWAAAGAARRRERRGETLAEARDAATAAEAVHGKLTALLAEHGLDPVPEPDAHRHSTAVALAVQDAEHAHRRAAERQQQAAELTGQRAGHETAARVARALAGHLAANRFERWLLAEALDRLVEGASAILRELTGGQYDLSHENGEFLVVDHHDADLRRPVRTLSGGETFQASLALALALSEQLAGMSSGAASLESILLDEGFGTLDAGTLDTVAATLESLADRGDRMVGVVTHVTELADRIPVRFEVARTAHTAQVTRIEEGA